MTAPSSAALYPLCTPGLAVAETRDKGELSTSTRATTLVLLRCFSLRGQVTKGGGMRPNLTKTLFAAVHLVGLLAMCPTAFAHESWKDSWEHDAIHEDMDRLHDDFHQFPHSAKEHRRFHKELKREHKRMDRQLRQEWNRERYGYGQ